MIRDLRPDEVEFTLTQTPEGIGYRDNCSAIDDEQDAKVEEWIQDQLDSGNGWAWCQVEVKAMWQGISCSSFLGGCSYQSEDNFKACGYWEDMKLEALAILNAHLKGLELTLEKLRID